MIGNWKKLSFSKLPEIPLQDEHPISCSPGCWNRRIKLPRWRTASDHCVRSVIHTQVQLCKIFSFAFESLLVPHFKGPRDDVSIQIGQGIDIKKILKFNWLKSIYFNIQPSNLQLTRFYDHLKYIMRWLAAVVSSCYIENDHKIESTEHCLIRS